MNEKNLKKSDSHFSILLLVVSVLTLIHWLVLFWGNPILDNLPYWKFKLHITPVNPSWIVLAFSAFGLAILLSFSNSNYILKLFGLILLGTIIQYSFAFSKGQGLDGIRIRLLGGGHAEFAKVAVRPLSMRAVAMNYESLLSEKYYGFLPSKPPGTLLYYMLTNKIAQVFIPSQDKETRLANLATFASLTWPLMSYLVIFPVFFLTRELFDDPDTGIIAGLIYISVPSVNLITLVTDQTIYPFLAIFSILLAVLACRRNNLALAFLSGIAFNGAIYFSFGLAVVGILFLLPIFVSVPNRTLRPFADWIRYSAAIGLGALVSNAAAYFLTNYNMFVRYRGAINHHLQWKGWENTFETFIKAGITDMVEFSVWIGLPLAVLFFVCCSDSIRRFILRKPDAGSFYTAAIAGIFVFLLLFGKTKAESARLWLFMVPFLCISTANFINGQNWPKRNKIAFTIAALLLEMGTTYFTLHYQNFG